MRESQRIIGILVVLAGALLALHCGKAPQRNSNPTAKTDGPMCLDCDEIPESSKTEGSAKTGGASLTARAALFKETVHKPITQYCAACHAQGTSPEMAQEDSVKALEALEIGKKLDYESPERSRVVQRLAIEGHNCWLSCSEDGKLMTDAVKEYVTKVSEAKLLPEPETFKETERVAFSSASEADGTPLSGVYVQFASMGTGAVAPMTAKTDDKDGDIATYYSTATANQGEVSYTMNVTEAGNYAVWLKVKNAGNAANTLRISVNNAAPIIWTQNPSAMSFTWDSVKPQRNQPATQFNLQPGQHTVKVLGQAANSKFNTVALTKILADFQGAEVVGKVKVIRVPLKDWAPGKNAALIVEVSEVDAKTKTSQIRNLKLVSDKPIKIKDIRPLINGHYDSRWAGYRAIDVDLPATGADGVLLSRAAQIVFGDGFSADKLSFTFSAIQ